MELPKRLIPANRRFRPADYHANLPTQGGYFGTLHPPNRRSLEFPSSVHPPIRPSIPSILPQDISRRDCFILASRQSGTHPKIRVLSDTDES